MEIALFQEEIYAFIKDGITSLRFRPGERLRAAEIAALVDSSRTPVREALGRLEQDGLVQRDDGWGYVVRSISVRDILELYSVREALEVLAAVEAVPHLTDAAVAELEALNRAAEAFFDARQHDSFLSQNRRFHMAIGRISGNALLQQMLGAIQDRVRLVGSMIVQAHGPRLSELRQENRAIMAALRARDATALESAMRAHVRRGREHVMRLIQSGNIVGAVSPTIAAAPAPRPLSEGGHPARRKAMR